MIKVENVKPLEGQVGMEFANMANEKAKKNRAKKRRNETFRDCLLGLAVGMGFGALVCGFYVHNNPQPVKAETVNTTTQEVCQDIGRSTYVICDVVEWYNTDTGAELVCEMPTGDLEVYSVIDAPEEIFEVCFEAKTPEDYTTYEVVALR